MTHPVGIEALRKAIDQLGSQAAVAAAVGIKQQSVSDMVRKGARVPAEWCLPLERAVAEKIAETGEGVAITRHDLRPDLYPVEPAFAPQQPGRAA